MNPAHPQRPEEGQGTHGGGACPAQTQIPFGRFLSQIPIRIMGAEKGPSRSSIRVWSFSIKKREKSELKYLCCFPRFTHAEDAGPMGPEASLVTAQAADGPSHGRDCVSLRSRPSDLSRPVGALAGRRVTAARPRAGGSRHRPRRGRPSVGSSRSQRQSPQKADGKLSRHS